MPSWHHQHAIPLKAPCLMPSPLHLWGDGETPALSTFGGVEQVGARKESARKESADVALQTSIGSIEEEEEVEVSSLN